MFSLNPFLKLEFETIEINSLFCECPSPRWEAVCSVILDVINPHKTGNLPRMYPGLYPIVAEIGSNPT